jgi:hypothetical protein
LARPATLANSGVILRDENNGGALSPHIEHLERRDVPSCSVGIDGVRLNVICAGGPPDIVTLDHTVFSASVVINGSPPRYFADTLYSSIHVFGGPNGLTTNIRGNVRPLSLLGYHDSDTVNIGDLNNRVQSIQGTVVLESYFSNNVNIHDEGDLSARTATVNVVPNGLFPYESVSFSGSAEIDCYLPDTRSVTVNTSSAGSTVYVLATAGSTATTISQRGAATWSTWAAGELGQAPWQTSMAH